MSRQEDKNNKVEELEAEINRMKKGLKRKQNKSILGCSGCLITLLVIIIIVSGFGAYFLAKSGLKEVPYLTEKFYQEPEPSHLVDPANLTEAEKDILAQLEELISQEAVRQQKTSDLRVKFDLREEVLTVLLRDKLKETNSLDEKIEYVQLAVLPESLELFIENKEPSRLVITLNIVPTIKDGKSDFKVINFKIGDLTLPNFIGNISFAFIAEKSLNSFLNFSAAYGKIENIELSNGVVTLGILINNLKELL